MHVTLVVSAGPMAGRKLWLGRGQTLSVGRTELAESVLPDDPRMSSVHFVLSFHGTSAQIRDHDSANGTFLNGQRIREAALHDGDQIVAGQTQFQVHVDSSYLTAGPTVQVAVVADQVSQAEADLSTEPTPLMAMVNQTPFSAAIMPWENALGEGRLTVILKATFSIAPNGDVQPAPQQLPIFVGDRCEGDDPLAPVQLRVGHGPLQTAPTSSWSGTPTRRAGGPSPSWTCGCASAPGSILSASLATAGGGSLPG